MLCKAKLKNLAKVHACKYVSPVAFCKDDSQGLLAASAHVAAGIANVDTRAITMRLRDTGCLNGVICDDLSVPVEELVARCKSWTIVGKDLIKEVRCLYMLSALRSPAGRGWCAEKAGRRQQVPAQE